MTAETREKLRLEVARLAKSDDERVQAALRVMLGRYPELAPELAKGESVTKPQ